MLVKFAEDVTDRSSLNCSTDSNASYNKIAREGIFVGLRQYRFFGEFIFFHHGLVCFSYDIIITQIPLDKQAECG